MLRTVALVVAANRDNLAVAILVHHLLHKANIVVLGKVPVLEKIGTLMWRHALNEMVDNLVRNERVPKVKLRDIWLYSC